MAFKDYLYVIRKLAYISVKHHFFGLTLFKDILVCLIVPLRSKLYIFWQS